MPKHRKYQTASIYIILLIESIFFSTSSQLIPEGRPISYEKTKKKKWMNEKQDEERKKLKKCEQQKIALIIK